MSFEGLESMSSTTFLFTATQLFSFNFSVITIVIVIHLDSNDGISIMVGFNPSSAIFIRTFP
jgi:hypothetical protein